MSTEVAKLDLPVSLKELNAGSSLATDSIFGDLAKGGGWLPRLQLFSAGTKECKAGRMPMNHYGLVISKDKIMDLGKQVDVLPLSWRPKAFQILTDAFLTIYDPKDPEFKRIAETSETPDSGCMFGPEFLIWIPAPVERFATFFMSSKSARIEAPNLKEKLDLERAATLDSVFIEGKKHQWQNPLIKACSTPFEVPNAESITEQVHKFLNPPKSEVEAAEPAETQRPR